MITNVIKIDNENDSRLADAAAIIKNGGLVVFPTETVYGLGANALDENAAKKIYAAKGRPSDNPLIVHVANPQDYINFAVCENKALFNAIAEKFMPGPITVIMKKRDTVPDSVTGGLDSVAIRCPLNPIARKLIELAGVPIAAPSANISGRPSPTKAEHAIEDLDGRVELIIDGGDSEVGLESTIISLIGEQVKLLRPGKITPHELEEVCGKIIIDPAVTSKLSDGVKPLAPGMKYRHYAPQAPLFAVKGDDTKVLEFFNKRFNDGSGILCFDEDMGKLPKSERIISFGHKGKIEEQARELFDSLRYFDKLHLKEIYARCPNDDGIGFAVYNRLIKACGYNIIDLNRIKIVGLCGQIGSGKSKVCDYLRNQGIFCIDSDKVYNNLVSQKSECLDRIVEVFSSEVLEDGKLNRKKLSKIVFSDSDKLEKLNDMTHYYITLEIDRLVLDRQKQGETVIVVEAPLLFESGFNKKCDITVGIVSNFSVKEKRIITRDGVTLEEAKKRLSSQKKDAFLKENCDYIIENNGSSDELYFKTNAVFGEIMK